MSTQEVTTSTPTHTLHGKWDLYYHLPLNKKWDAASYKVISREFSTMEHVVALNTNIPEKIVKLCMLFVMRDGIKPMWEDPQNRNGGCFSFKVLNKQVFEVWKHLFYSICGETLFTDSKLNKNVNGITTSPKKNFCIVKVWLRDCSVQDPSLLISIPELSKQGCLFKRHAPEF
tara:strand:+ start:662 stop:1180 length:519 start_codon:yes stop_codon:yes gene_type:complete